MAKLNLQHDYASLQCLVILQKIIPIYWFAAQDMFIISVENSCVAL